MEQDTDFQAKKRVVRRSKPDRLPAKFARNLIETESRYIEPVFCPDIPEEYLIYKRAEELAERTTITLNSCNRHWLDGSFIFGDYIESLFVTYNIHADMLSIGTLGMSQNNVDSLTNLLVGGYIDRLELIISDYMYQNERYKLIPYLYQKLDIENRFQLAVAGYHGKICLFRTDGGKHVVIHGSANLRSSGNIEHIMVQESSELYGCDSLVHRRIQDRFYTINQQAISTIADTFRVGQTPDDVQWKAVQSLRHKKLWLSVKLCGTGFVE